MNMKAINIEWYIDPDECECGIVLLPTEIEIPEYITDLDDVSDYIYDITGFYLKGFEIEDDN